MLQSYNKFEKYFRLIILSLEFSQMYISSGCEQETPV
uniref:Uncharacterized protein n=1 Tax=Rhizophora mucronata TaxID=61149 RepID=A0A2P2Q808_RHIMU